MNHGLFLNEKVKNTISEISEVAQYFWEKGWAEKNAGNISVNITKIVPEGFSGFDDDEIFPLKSRIPSINKNIFLLTATGVRMRDLARNPAEGLCFIMVDHEGTGYRLGGLLENEDDISKRLPTSELPSHLAIQEMFLRTQSEMNVVIHAHVPEFIALSQIHEFRSEQALNKLLFGMHPEVKMFIPNGTGFVPYSLPGSDSIVPLTVKELEKHSVVVWEKHGLLATGKSVVEAFDSMDILTKAAKIFMLCRNAGYTPEGLTDQQINDLSFPSQV